MMLATAAPVLKHLGASPARPCACAAVSAHPLDDELILYDERTGEAHLLNHTGAFIWRLCDGSRTIGQVARQAATAFGIPHRRALADVRELVALLSDADLIHVR
ncbi:MAG TPA: PqqD family protein [Thermomicrobiales bacterium]|nr:PqqD family protein [Thermomicrobiales bacterium]